MKQHSEKVDAKKPAVSNMPPRKKQRLSSSPTEPKGPLLVIEPDYNETLALKILECFDTYLDRQKRDLRVKLHRWAQTNSVQGVRFIQNDRFEMFLKAQGKESNAFDTLIKEMQDEILGHDRKKSAINKGDSSSQEQGGNSNDDAKDSPSGAGWDSNVEDHPVDEIQSSNERNVEDNSNTAASFDTKDALSIRVAQMTVDEIKLTILGYSEAQARKDPRIADMYVFDNYSFLINFTKCLEQVPVGSNKKMSVFRYAMFGVVKEGSNFGLTKVLHVSTSAH
jgi:hypothetical protein